VNSLYRLVSRSVQLLSLLDLLAYAHEVPSLSPVNWSLIDKLTFKDLATTEAAARSIKEILRDLTSSQNAVNDAHAEKLSQALHEQCYGFYSLGDKLTQEGVNLSSKDIVASGVVLRKAAKWWNKPAVRGGGGGGLSLAGQGQASLRSRPSSLRSRPALHHPLTCLSSPLAPPSSLRSLRTSRRVASSRRAWTCSSSTATSAASWTCAWWWRATSAGP
jgi:hypothetical protein